MCIPVETLSETSSNMTVGGVAFHSACIYYVVLNHSREPDHTYTVFSRYWPHISYKCIFTNKRILFCWPQHSQLGAFHV